MAEFARHWPRNSRGQAPAEFWIESVRKERERVLPLREFRYRLKGPQPLLSLLLEPNGLGRLRIKPLQQLKSPLSQDLVHRPVLRISNDALCFFDKHRLIRRILQRRQAFDAVVLNQWRRLLKQMAEETSQLASVFDPALDGIQSIAAHQLAAVFHRDVEHRRVHFRQCDFTRKIARHSQPDAVVIVLLQGVNPGLENDRPVEVFSEGFGY